MKRITAFILPAIVCAVIADPLSRVGTFIGNLPRNEPGAPLGFPQIPGGADDARTDPYRKAGGRFWSVTPFFANPYTGLQSLPGWQLLHGTISQNTAEGVYIRTGLGKTFFIKNYPRKFPDGTMMTCLALQDGVRQFISVDQAQATVAQYDYGVPYNPFALPPKTNVNVKLLPNTNATRRAALTNKPMAPASTNALTNSSSMRSNLLTP